jgi:hypothetical protein
MKSGFSSKCLCIFLAPMHACFFLEKHFTDLYKGLVVWNFIERYKDFSALVKSPSVQVDTPSKEKNASLCTFGSSNCRCCIIIL